MFTDEGHYSPEDLDPMLKELFHLIGEERVLDEVLNGTLAVPGSGHKQLILSIRYDFGIPMYDVRDYVPHDTAAIEERHHNPFAWNQANMSSTKVTSVEELPEAQEEDDSLSD